MSRAEEIDEAKRLRLSSRLYAVIGMDADRDGDFGKAYFFLSLAQLTYPDFFFDPEDGVWRIKIRILDKWQDRGISRAGVIIPALQKVTHNVSWHFAVPRDIMGNFLLRELREGIHEEEERSFIITRRPAVLKY